MFKKIIKIKLHKTMVSQFYHYFPLILSFIFMEWVEGSLLKLSFVLLKGLFTHLKTGHPKVSFRWFAVFWPKKLWGLVESGSVECCIILNGTKRRNTWSRTNKMLNCEKKFCKPYIFHLSDCLYLNSWMKFSPFPAFLLQDQILCL